MDAFEDLARAVVAEDEAKHKMYEAQAKLRRVVEDNLPKFIGSGVITIKVNKNALRRMVGPQASMALGTPIKR